MQGFDFNNWITKYEDFVRANIGADYDFSHGEFFSIKDDYIEILNKVNKVNNSGYEQAKDIFINEEKREIENCNYLLFDGSCNEIYKDWFHEAKSPEFLSEYYSINQPIKASDFIDGLRVYCAGHNYKDPIVRDECKKIKVSINHYARKGFNIYEVMNRLQKNIHELSSIISSTDDTSHLEAMLKGHEVALDLLEQSKRFSPYEQVFSMSERLVKLKNELDKAMEGDDVKKQEQIDKQIDSCEKQLNNLCRGLDPTFLKYVATSKKDYIASKSSQDGLTQLSNEDNISRQGLNEVLKIAQKIENKMGPSGYVS